MEIYSPNQMAQIYTAMFQELLVVPCGENHMHGVASCIVIPRDQQHRGGSRGRHNYFSLIILSNGLHHM